MTQDDLLAIENWEERASQSFWSVKALAINCGVSPRTLQRYWKKHRQVPLAEWLEEQRFVCACFLLRQPDVKVDSVAHAVGYSRIGAFSYAFSVRFGFSPTKWREHYPLISIEDSNFATAALCTAQTLSQLRKLSSLPRSQSAGYNVGGVFEAFKSPRTG